MITSLSFFENTPSFFTVNCSPSLFFPATSENAWHTTWFNNLASEAEFTVPELATEVANVPRIGIRAPERGISACAAPSSEKSNWMRVVAFVVLVFFGVGGAEETEAILALTPAASEQNIAPI